MATLRGRERNTDEINIDHLHCCCLSGYPSRCCYTVEYSFVLHMNASHYDMIFLRYTSRADHLLRGIVRTLASICFSSMVGRWVDQNPDRLRTLLSTISVNRFTVIGASVLWFLIVDPQASGPQVTASVSSFSGLLIPLVLKGGIFSLILILGIFEALSASGNMLSMERDWVVTAAAPDGQPYDLTHLNSVMRRIDLICKLVAPLLISVIISATNNSIGVIVVGGMSAASWATEMFCARIVWNRNPHLQAPKIVPEVGLSSGGEDTLSLLRPGFLGRVSRGLEQYLQDFKNYFSCTVWVPSLALSLLHLSALSYGATFITFLLNIGFSLELITIARAAGSIVEISSTVVTPVGVQYLGRASSHGRFRGRDIMTEGDVATLLSGGPDQENTNTETG